jgi:glycerophosphoryl diester phosphodiesterase
VHHDARYADGRAVADVDAASRPADVPSFDDALDACARMGVNVEIKNAAGEPGYDAGASIADVVVGALQARAGDVPPILVSSFDVAVLDRVRALDPSVPTALLTFTLDDPLATIAAAVAAGHHALHPYDLTVDAGLVAAAHEVGLAINVWTVDDPGRITELAKLGVDGICTNVPDVAVAALARRLR